MGETTEIRWTDSTFNPWWGCARVSEACQHCYAESWAKRFGVEWGKKAERRTFGDKHWNEPFRWNRQAESAGVRRLVFCASMADVFEDHPELPPERERLWGLIAATPALTWQLLTKRPENILAMVPKAWLGSWPANVWAGTTVETQRWADERLPILAAVPAPVRFASCEPLFGHLNMSDHLSYEGSPGVNWVIAGGESGPKAQPSHPNWFRNLRDTCAAMNVPFLFKQWGEWAPVEPDEWQNRRETDHLIRPDGYSWPLRQPHGSGDELPSTVTVRKVGKKAAGYVLDGRTHDGIPA